MEAVPQSILVEVSNGLRRITLNRAGKANAMTAAMTSELADAVSAARQGELVILQSASNKVFCAGADVTEFVEGGLGRQEAALLALIGAFSRSQAPVIALARGRAAGAGAILVALCDAVIAGDDLEIVCPEMLFGMYPIVVEAVLQSRLSPALASRLCLGSGSLDAAAAQELGLVTDVVPSGDFDAQALKRCDWYAQRTPALAALRRGRNSSPATQALGQQLHAIGPLLLENFEAPGVRESIATYVNALGRRHAR